MDGIARGARWSLTRPPAQRPIIVVGCSRAQRLTAAKRSGVAAGAGGQRIERSRPAVKRLPERLFGRRVRKVIDHRTEKRAGSLLFFLVPVEECQDRIDQRMRPGACRQGSQQTLRVVRSICPTKGLELPGGCLSIRAKRHTPG